MSPRRHPAALPSDTASAATFGDLTLHDATLRSIDIDWAAGICTLVVAPMSGGVGELRFDGIAEVVVPRRQPWGPSVSIDELRMADDGAFEIGLQSGDVLRVAATGWSYATYARTDE